MKMKKADEMASWQKEFISEIEISFESKTLNLSEWKRIIF